MYCNSQQNKGEVGCVMLGPSCTYATFQLVEWVWLILSILCLYHLTTDWYLTFHPLLFALVMKLAWAWAFPLSLPGASDSRVTINPNWPAFCLQHARSLTYSSTLWGIPCHLRRKLGSRSMSTRSPATQPRTASGETTQAAGYLSDLCSFIWLASISHFWCFITTGTSMHWKHPLPTLLHGLTERCCVGRASWRMP